MGLGSSLVHKLIQLSDWMTDFAFFFHMGKYDAQITDTLIDLNGCYLLMKITNKPTRNIYTTQR